MPNPLEQSIIKTLAFFDIFNYPLTLTELWKWLYRPGTGRQPVSLSELKEILATSQWLKEKVVQVEGFYALVGREASYLIRKRHNNLAEHKFDLAVRLIKIYRYLPFIKMIAVCNSLAYSNTREESDIDLFIITARGKLWLVRLLTIAVVKILHLRPQPDHSRDTFCLSFFIDEDYLNIKDVMITSQTDVYYPYWLEQVLPIYDQDNTYAKFLAANDWCQDYLPNGLPNQFVHEVKDNIFSRLIKSILGFIFSPPLLNHWLDNVYRRLQTRIIDRNLHELVNLDTRVVINERMLKFHQNDRREVFSKKWREKTRQLLGQE